MAQFINSSQVMMGVNLCRFWSGAKLLRLNSKFRRCPCLPDRGRRNFQCRFAYPSRLLLLCNAIAAKHWVMSVETQISPEFTCSAVPEGKRRCSGVSSSLQNRGRPSRVLSAGIGGASLWWSSREMFNGQLSKGCREVGLMPTARQGAVSNCASTWSWLSGHAASTV